MPPPTLKTVKQLLRNNLTSRLPNKVKIISAAIVGSVAKGTATPASDLDIAVVIPVRRGKTSMRFTENYHSRFRTEQQKPRYGGRVVDFQFFYDNDNDTALLQTYQQIKLGTKGPEPCHEQKAFT